MEKKIRFITNVQENVARERISQYLERSDYKLMDREKMSYARDTSRLGGMPAAFPKDLKVEVHVQTAPIYDEETEVIATLSVDTPGWQLGENERTFWESELEGVRAAVFAGSLYVSKNEQMAEAVSMRNWSLLSLASLPLMLALLVSVLFEHSAKIIILVVGLFIWLGISVYIVKYRLKVKLFNTGKYLRMDRKPDEKNH